MALEPQPCCGEGGGADGEVFTTTGLCLGDGTPIGIINRRVAGVVIQDGWVNLLTGAFSVGPPPVGTMSCGQSLNIQTSDVLCDITPGDGVVHGLVLIQYHYAPDGSITSTDVIDATDGTAYVPVGNITVCPTDTGVPDNDMQVLCDRLGDGTLVPFVRDFRRDVNGIINGFSDYTTGGAPYVVAGTVQTCIPRDSESVVLCDSNGTRFLRTYTYGSTGAVQTVFDTTLTGAAFAPVGAVGLCSGDFGDTEVTALCDVVAGTPVPFLRRQTFSSTGAVTSTVDTTPAGAPYVVVGTVAVCTQLDAETQVLCDAGNANKAYIRRLTYNTVTGLLVGTSTLNLDGSAYAVVGPEVACDSTIADTEPKILCADNGSFLRKFVYSSAGVLTGTVTTALDGSTPFVPVGTVRACADLTEPLDVNVVSSTPVSVSLGGSTAASATLTTATTGNGTTVDFTAARSNVSLFIQPNGTVTAGLVSLQASQNGTDWVTIGTSAVLATGVNQAVSLTGGAFRWFRGIVSENVTGGGTVTATLMFA